MFSNVKNNSVIIFSICLFSILNGQIDLNDKRLKDAARKLGVSSSQIKKMIPKSGLEDALGNSSSLQKSFKTQTDEDSVEDIKKSFKSDKSNDIKTDNESNLLKNDSNDSLNLKNDFLKEIQNEENKYFGYNVFKGNPELFQKSFDVSADGNYLLGPGDEIIIMLWGDTELNSNYFVSKDGYLFIENVGQVFVNGLSLDQLESKLLKLMKKSYSSLGTSSGSATTFFDVSLGAAVLRPVRIFILGELDQPGAYSVKSTTSLFNSLYYCNGPNLNGSLRSIKLLQGGKELAEIDYYDYLLSGKKTNDIKLQRDDVVFIPPRGKTIEIVGEIGRPAIYELKDVESLYDLINIGGGLKISTFMQRAQIKRIIPPNDRAFTGIDRTLIDVNLFDVMSKKINVEMVDGDKITFYSITDEVKNTVNVIGAVKRPGIYEIDKSLNIAKLIEKANGLVGDAFLDRADVIRTNEDFSKTQITINLQKAFNGDLSNNIFLKSKDVVTFYRSSDLFSKGFVTISGYVLNPGTTNLRENLNVEDLVFFGGGFKNEKRLEEIYLDRADLIREINKEKKKIIPFRLDSVLIGKGIAKMNLIDGDEIKVYSKYQIKGIWPRTVQIKGKVKNPGEYPLYENMKIRDLLRISAGFEDSVYVKRVYMERADLFRKDPNSEKFYIKKFNLSNVLNSQNENANFILKPYDEIIVHSRKDFYEDYNVSISGVMLPGTYKYKKNMTFGDLFLESGGIDKKFSEFRVEIFGKKSALAKNNELIYFDLKNVPIESYSETKNFNYVLQSDNYVRVRPFQGHAFEKLVKVTGEIKLPGLYSIFNKNDKVSDIIERAGGLTHESYPFASLLIRGNDTVRVSFEKIIKHPKSKKNFIVFDGDEIVIKSKPNVVKIEGSVNSPGLYQYLPGQRFKKYISMAGGLSPEALRTASYITYPNGTSKRLSYFSSPIVRDGSIIFIGTKPEQEPFSLTQWATDFTSIWAELSQAYLILSLIGQNSN